MLVDRTSNDLEFFHSDGIKQIALGFSGGKDSTAALKLLYSSLLSTQLPLKLILFYCDTGVEFPFARDYACSLIKKVVFEGRQHSVHVEGKILEPLPKHRFFVRVIGRGYPPPTNKFRWCTDKLRIRPVNEFLKAVGSVDATLPVVGVRFGESENRDRTLRKYASGSERVLRMRKSKRLIYAPIIDFDLVDVWETIFEIADPTSVDPHFVSALYKDMSGECPIIRDTKGKPCGAGRLGCWTCTVVRRDKAAENLIQAGANNIQPLLEFRDWLASIRDDADRRFPFRRNGNRAMGPFKLDTRKEILERLKQAESFSGLRLLTKVDEVEIEREWQTDPILG